MDNWLPIKRFAQLRNITEKAVRLGIERGKYLAQKTDDGIMVTCLIPTAPVHPAGALLQEGRESVMPAPPPFHVPTVPGDAGTFPIVQGRETGAAPVPAPLQGHGATAMPEKARTTALARLDLLKAWAAYRQHHGGTAQAADKDFHMAYNNGLMFQDIFKSLGKVSRQTLYRWYADLEGTQDWTRLAPQYHNRGNGMPQLTEHESKFFFNFLLSPNKIKIGTAYKLTKFTLEKHGHPTDKSQMTFRRYADHFKRNHYDVWVLMREGQKALRDKVEPFIRRDPSLLDVGDVLVADGHRLNFRVINPFTGKPCRATLIGYVDWKSYDLAGYEIMVEENTQCIASALRNSIIRLGRMPKVSYQDNGKAFKSRFFIGDVSLEECGINGLFGRLGIVPVFAMPYNARAKIIERWFKDFSDSFERLVPSFTGASINDKPAWMLRNEQFHKALHNEYVPSIEEAITMIEAWLEFHRAQQCPHVKGKTIGEVWHDGAGAIHELPLQELDDLMMATEIKNIRNTGIRFLNAEYYDDTLYGLREKVLIKYSLFDLSQIKVYSINGEPLCIAKRVEFTHPMAAVLGDANDVAGVKRGISHQRRLEKQTVNIAKEYLASKGTPPQLDWQKVAETSPRVIDKLVKENIELPGDERSIPAEAVTTSDKQRVTNNESRMTNDETRTFDEAYERYEYLITQTELSANDQQWMDEYVRSTEYIMIYGAQEAAG